MTTAIDPETASGTARPHDVPRWWPIARPGVQLANLGQARCLQLLDEADRGWLSFRNVMRLQSLELGYRVRGQTLRLGPVARSDGRTVALSQLALFQTDRLDDDARTGWSVALAGPVGVVERTDAGPDAVWLQMPLTALLGRWVSLPVPAPRTAR